jgi:hypothetical protein
LLLAHLSCEEFKLCTYIKVRSSQMDYSVSEVSIFLEIEVRGLLEFRNSRPAGATKQKPLSK